VKVSVQPKYRYERPGDEKVLGRIERHSGDPLENLSTARPDGAS
jgi:hypothetical protein